MRVYVTILKLKIYNVKIEVNCKAFKRNNQATIKQQRQHICMHDDKYLNEG